MALEALVHTSLLAPDAHRSLLGCTKKMKQMSPAITKLFNELSVLYDSHHQECF